MECRTCPGNAALTRIDGAVTRHFIGEADHLQPTTSIAPIQSYQLGCGVVARRAPASEDVYQYHLVPKTRVAVGHAPPIEIDEIEVERLRRVGTRHFGW